MGCCATKDAVVEQPEDESVSPDDPPTSPVAVASKKAKKPKKAKNNAWSRNKNNPSAKSGGSPSKPVGNSSAPAPPPGSVPINKGEAAPPGWGRTPEIVEEEEIEIELDGSSGPRGISNIPGGKGYITGTRKDQEISEGVKDRIQGLEDAGLRVKRKMGLKMLTPRIITDVKETWDEEGNLTRYMTHYIEEPDGRKHTKIEQLYIAAGDPDPMAPDPAVEAE